MGMTVIGRPSGLAYVLAALAMLVPLAARADFHIRSPDEIDQAEWEFETNGAASFDHNPSRSGATSYTAEIGGGLTSWWRPELEFNFARDAGLGQRTKAQGATWENTFELTEPGENWLDLGFYWEYSLSTQRQKAHDTLFGPLLQKDVGRTTHTLNLFFAKEIGPNQNVHGYDFSYAWQSRWNIYRYASPAIEFYGDAGQIDRVAKFQDQQLIVGPVLVGSVPVGTSGKLKYEAGYLFGATNASPNGTIRWKLEWETHF